jgi:hypothetical protein
MIIRSASSMFSLATWTWRRWVLPVLRRKRWDRTYHPAALLKIYIYGYFNRIQSIRPLERETPRNIELMWLTGRLMPDFKTIADFRRRARAKSSSSGCSERKPISNTAPPADWA